MMQIDSETKESGLKRSQHTNSASNPAAAVGTAHDSEIDDSAREWTWKDGAETAEFLEPRRIVLCDHDRTAYVLDGNNK